MHSIALTVGPQKDRYRAGSLGCADRRKSHVGSADGRGVIQLHNVDGNASFYLAFGDTEPGPGAAGIPVPVGKRFPEDIQITPDGGVWAWANKAGTKLQAVVVGWS